MRKCKSKYNYWATIKIDFQKAYDCISWEFVRIILSYMKFLDIWIQIIMQCISIVSYQIIINGERIKTFWPQREIRQGDPLSPYIFILCANVLSHMIEYAKEKDIIQGVRASCNAPRISHLMFVDDLILFIKIMDESC